MCLQEIGAEINSPKEDRTMQVGSAMTTDVATVNAQDTIAEVATKMREQDVGFVPVVVDATVLGVVSDRDIAVRVLGRGLDPQSTIVRDIVSTHPISCGASDGVHDAARIMEEHGVRRLVVLDEDQHLAGVFSLADLAARAREHALAGEVLGSISARE
jgi:CBS domain-containing protein